MTATMDEIVDAEVLDVVINEPGLYADLPNDVYQSDPIPGRSLSSSGARRLLDCPAKFHHERTAGRAPKRAFDLGHAAHKEVLGVGECLVWVDAKDWRTKAAQEEQAAAYAVGKVPLLVGDKPRVEAMAKALRENEYAAALLAPGSGVPEASIVWRDEPSGVMCRARFDWLPHVEDGFRLIVPDYKTCQNGHPSTCQKSIASYGYHQQADWYLSGLKALGMAGDQEPAFVFIFQETTAPYVVTIVQPDARAMEIAADLNRRAIDLYVHYSNTNRWPGYADGPLTMPLPAWVERAYDFQGA